MLLRICSVLGMLASACALLVGGIDGNGQFLLMPFSITFSASIIALAIGEFNRSIK